MQEKSFINYQLGIKFKSYIDYKCRVWFKAKEVAKILGYCDTKKAIKQHVSVKNKIIELINPNVGGYETPRQQKDTRGKYCILVNEPGFYELVFKSRLPSAKMFREWVFNKVLPSIRKYGYYRMIDSRIKQKIIIERVKYYKHTVFDNYAASKNGEVINLKNKNKIKITKDSGGYFKFIIFSKKVEKPINYYQHRFVFEVFKGVIPRCFEVDHINNVKSDNRLKNLQLLTHKRNVEKSKNKAIISTCIETGKERRFISIKTASIELGISYDSISKICRKKGKTASSKKDGHKYTFKFLD